MTSTLKTLAFLAILIVFIVPHPSSGFYKIGRRELTPRYNGEGEEIVGTPQKAGFDDWLRNRLSLREERRMEKLNKMNKNQ